MRCKSTMGVRWCVWVLMLVLLATVGACKRGVDAPQVRDGQQGGDGDGDVSGDAGIDAGLGCERHSDCDDGLFCTGVERCESGTCMAGEARSCDDGIECTRDRCDEALARCVNAAPDADNDGFGDAACIGADGAPLGTDCDDGDDNRYPGNREVCDDDAHDEDCDLTTFGIVDADDDGYASGACCNRNVEGTPVCGRDCDDAEPGVSPTSPEVCNRIDDDCDGSTDEGLPQIAWSPDCDGDGFGDARAVQLLNCAEPLSPATCDDMSGTWVSLPGDCDETDNGRNPAAPEVCNFKDDDCDDIVDDITPGAVICYAGQTRSCTNVCGEPGVEQCAADCLGFDVCLAEEACNGCDDDADGRVDDGFGCALGESEACITHCNTSGTRVCGEACEWNACLASESCNYCDDDGDGSLLDERADATNFTLDGRIACSGPSDRVTIFGGARCDAVNDNEDTDLYAVLLDGSAAPQRAAYWYDTGVSTGWGRLRVVAEVQARVVGGGTPYGGWSLVIADRDASTLGEDVSGVEGVWVDWYWASELVTGPGSEYPPSPGDAFRYRAGGRPLGFNDQGSSSVSQGISISGTADLDQGDTDWVTQRVVIDYTPDDPSTFVNEEVVVVSAGGVTQTYEVDNLIYTNDPDHDLPLHIPLVIGFVANSRRRLYDNINPPDGVTIGTEVELRVHLETIDVPSGPGSPNFIEHSFFDRYDHCPGM